MDPSDRLRLEAELLAVPFSSEAALQLGPVALDPHGDADTHQLWQHEEVRFAREFRVLSLDGLIHSRDAAWHPPNRITGELPKGPVFLEDMLRSAVVETLGARGSRLIPRRRELRVERAAGPGGGRSLAAEGRWHWRFLTWALPPDLLVAAHPESVGTVDGLPPSLSRMLTDRQFAEVHLHLGAAWDFSALWSLMAAALVDPRTEARAFESVGGPFGGGRGLAGWLVQAQVARVVGAAWLRTGGGVPLPRWLDEQLGRGRRARGVLAAARGHELRLLQVVQRMLRGVAPDEGDFEADRGLLAALVPTVGDRRRLRLQETLARDPIGRWFPPAPGTIGSCELSFLQAGMEELRHERRRAESGPRQIQKGADFRTLFWQLVRVRSLFYRYLVQRPGVVGLRWFVRHYRRTRAVLAAGDLSSALESALVRSGQGKGLRSLELRWSVPDDPGRLFEVATELHEAWARVGAPGVELAMVLHFNRRRLQRTERWGSAYGLGTDANPLGSVFDRLQAASHSLDEGAVAPGGARFEKTWRRWTVLAESMARALTEHPSLLTVIRGVDVCSEELSVPNWVAAPFFRYVRKVSRAVSRALLVERGRDVPPLRGTVHCGEDWMHLMGGLRRIDEVVRHMMLREGDRLGHAMALGVKVERWVERHGRVQLPHGERLQDLVWEWSLWSSGRGRSPQGRYLVLARELARLSHFVFKRSVEPHVLENMFRSLFDRRALRALGYPGDPGRRQGMRQQSSAAPSDESAELLSQWLFDAEVYERSMAPMWVETTGEAACLIEMQRVLRRDVAQGGIAVEVNPSSNLMIGQLGELLDHPLWRMRPPRPSEDDPPPLSVVIGSDDPLTFATGLREEYGLVYDSLVRAGLGHDVALSWVDQARRASLDHRFSLAVEEVEAPGAWTGVDAFRTFWP